MIPFKAMRAWHNYDSGGCRTSIYKKAPVIVIEFLPTGQGWGGEGRAVCITEDNRLCEVPIPDIVDAELPGIQWEHIK